MIHNIFLQISILLGITVSIAVIIRLLRQPFIVAYIIAGVVAGPLFLNLIRGDEQFFHSFSEFGVVLLLFIVGLSLDFRHIKSVGNVAITTGLGQLFFTALFGWLLLRGLGLAFLPALYIAVAATFSSTIIIIKLLSDKKALETVYGRYTVGLLLVQDLFAILIMIFLSTRSEGSLTTHIALLAGKGLLLGGAIYLLSKTILPLFLHKIAKSSEFLFLFTLAWCFGIASLVYWVGFSIEIGAVIAGISLGSSPYHLEIASRIKPLRDFFIVLFFIILGSELSLQDAKTALIPSLCLSAFILIGNPIILYLMYRWHKFTRRNSFLGAIAAAQVSEFGFILIFTGLSSGQIPDLVLAIFTIAALITIFISSYLMTYNEQIYQWCLPFFRLFGPDTRIQQEEPGERFDVWVIGYHRIGWKICEVLKHKGVSFAVIDYNPEAITKMHRAGIRCFYGDISDIEFLGEMPLLSAKLIISTIPEPEPQSTLFKYIRERSSSIILIGNLHESIYLNDLYKTGAHYVMMPHLLGGNWMADVLAEKKWTKLMFKKLRTYQLADIKKRFKADT